MKKMNRFISFLTAALALAALVIAWLFRETRGGALTMGILLLLCFALGIAETCLTGCTRKEKLLTAVLYGMPMILVSLWLCNLYCSVIPREKADMLCMGIALLLWVPGSVLKICIRREAEKEGEK